MKLTSREIPSFLKARPPVPVVLVYGPDHGLVRARATILGGHVVQDLDDPFNVAVLTGAQIAEDPARLADEAAAISLMGGDRLVWVREGTDGITPTLKSYLTAPQKTALVVIEGGDLTPKSSLRKLVEADRNAAALPCYVQDAGDLVRVITQEITAADLKIDPDAAAFLASAIGGDYQQVRSEIDKLLTYMGVDANGKGMGTRVTLEDAAACCGGMGLAAIDSFVDALMGGETARMSGLLKRLQDEEGYPIALLRALLAHGRKLGTVHARVSSGERVEDILESRDAPVFFKRKAAFGAQLKRWPMPKLARFMDDVFSCEVRMKSGTEPEVTIPQTFLALSLRAGK